MADDKEQSAKKQAIREYYNLLPPGGSYRTGAGVASKVIGIGLGAKIKDENVVADRCVRFYVERKIKPKESIDERFRIKEKLGDVPTDVIATGRFATFQSKAAPGSTIGPDLVASNVPPGIAGTLGAIVTMGGKSYVLASNHVMTVNGRVPPGTEVLFRPPGHFIDDPQDYVVAKTAAFVRLLPGKVNRVDCALAELKDPARVEAKFPGRIVVASADATPPQRGDLVARVDQSDNVTGVIHDADARVRIDYRFGTFDFDDLVLIEGADGKPFARPGDSGALVLAVNPKTSKGTATAMVIGGSGKYTIACPLAKVFELLEAELAKSNPRKYVNGKPVKPVAGKGKPSRKLTLVLR